MLVRVIVGFLVLLTVWYIASKAISFFDPSVGRKSATRLELRTPEGVQVSLQGESWQRGETNLKMYASDAALTRANGDAILHFFDGSTVRLDTGTEILIEKSDHQADGTSVIEINVRSGRIWFSSPSQEAFSGAIIRIVHTGNYDAAIPDGSEALLSFTLLNVIRASGLGVHATMTFSDKKPSLTVGEGQYLPVSEQMKRLIEDGADPYEFRDPVTLELLQDPFLISSLSVAGQRPAPNLSGTGSVSSETEESRPLTVTSPEDQARVNERTVTVAGSVSPRIAQVRVNSQLVAIQSDLTFSVDISMPSTPTVQITVEATDTQGIPLGKIERTVVNDFKVIVEPVRIKSPVGSGETLTTALQEIEITGEAPTGTVGVEVNDYKLQLFKPGAKTWSYLASTLLGNMKPGENIYSVRAIDEAGNKSEPRRITIVLSGDMVANDESSSSPPPLKQNPPLTPGILSVQKPAAGTVFDTSEREIVLEGLTTDATHSISINGYTLSLYEAGKTTWNYIASVELETMKRGKNVYRVVARNAGGEILDVLEYTINFKP